MQVCTGKQINRWKKISTGDFRSPDVTLDVQRLQYSARIVEAKEW